MIMSGSDVGESTTFGCCDVQRIQDEKVKFGDLRTEKMHAGIFLRTKLNGSFKQKQR